MTDAANDPSLSSYYVGDEFYDDLVAAFADWDRDDRLLDDPVLRDRCRGFLEREARALDQNRLDDWLALFAPECAYWVPGTPERNDPRREIAFAFHDRRQLEDRIFRLQTSYAWSQTPVSRTVRMLSNVEVFRDLREDAVMVRANFQISEFRDGHWHHWAGFTGHRLLRGEGGFLILAKQINLIDCDQNQRNPSLTL